MMKKDDNKILGGGGKFDPDHLTKDTLRDKVKKYPTNQEFRKQDFDQSSLEAYERYVKAPFTHQPNMVEKERQDAINSLIPGTERYYHLYFLHLAKTKQSLSDLSDHEKELYTNFAKKFGDSPLFLEVETRFRIINQVPGLKKITDKSSEKEIDEMLKVYMQYYDSFIGPKFIKENRRVFEQREYMKQESVVNNESDVSMQGSDSQYNNTEYLDQNLIKQNYREEKLAEAQKVLEKTGTSQEIHGFENELDWSKSRNQKDALDWAYMLINNSPAYDKLEFFEIDSDSFFKRIAEAYDASQKKQIHGYPHQGFGGPSQGSGSIPPSFFNAFTIEQLNKCNSHTKPLGHNLIQKEPGFAMAFFSKTFSEELSKEYQEFLTQDQKLANLKNLLEFAEKHVGADSSLVQNLLHEIMTLTIKLDQLDEELFKKYLRAPLEMNQHLNKEAMKRNKASFSSYQLWSDCLQNVQENSRKRYASTSWHSESASDVIPQYLEWICKTNNGKLNGYEQYFSPDYLVKFVNQYQVFSSDNGLIDLSKDVDPATYKMIQNQVILKFKETNKDTFKVEEEVVLKLQIKNVPNLTIKIFEFNTETYYKKNLKPFDTSINLDGMVASHEETKQYADPKNKIHDEEFRFPGLTGKVGLFIVEFQGNGKQSRAVVKKGSLTLIHKSTAAGHSAFIIDHNRKVCNSQRTGLWIDGKFYAADKENGSICIPYAKQRKVHTTIMINDDFAQLTEFDRKTENYDSFKVFYHLNFESMLVGSQAQILVKPILNINGRKTSVTLLQNAKVTIKIRNFIDGSEVTKTFENLKFRDDEDMVLNFRVPPNVEDLVINMTAQVLNATNQKMETKVAPTKEVDLRTWKDRANNKEFYLRKIGDEYFLYLLGRNGEGCEGKKVKLLLRYPGGNIKTELTSDSEGKVGLGKLPLVTDISATYKDEHLHGARSEAWSIKTHNFDQWTQADDYHITQEEGQVSIPINQATLAKHEVSLRKKIDGKTLANLYDKIKIVPVASGKYYELQLTGLDVGEYVLKLRLYYQDPVTINIQVHKGEYWQDKKFILKDTSLFESSTQKQALRLETITSNHDQAAKKTKVNIDMKNFTADTRVHIFANQFMMNYPNELRESLEQANYSAIAMTKFPFASWKNLYESDFQMSDEIMYVLDRQKKESKMGNNLDRPTLLMKRNFLRTAATDEEALNKGDTRHAMEQQDIQQSAMEEMGGSQRRMMRQAMAPAARQQRMMKSAEGYYGGGGGGGGGGSSQMYAYDQDAIATCNILKDYSNFLSCAPHQYFNLKHSNGKVSVEIPDLQNYSQLLIVGSNGDSVVQRIVTVKELLNQSKPEQVPKRNLTIIKEQQDDSKALIDQSEQAPLPAGQSIKIQDISSSKFLIVDTLKKALRIIDAVHNKVGENLDNHMRTMNENVVINWTTFDANKKRNKYSRSVCSELNFFLYHRDPEFYKQVVKPFIQNKFDKHIVDWYLLGLDQDASSKFAQIMLKYLENLEVFEELRVMERCLVIDFAMRKGSAEQKAKARILGANAVQDIEWEYKLSMEGSHYKNRMLQEFDKVLNVANLDEDENKEKIEKALRDDAPMEDDVVLMDYRERNADYDYEDEEMYGEYDSDDDDYENLDHEYRGGGGGGGDMIVAECLETRPRKAKKVREVQAPPDASGLFGNFNQVRDMRRQLVKEKGYQELAKTGEYAETHYATLRYPTQCDHHHRTLFHAAFLKHVLNEAADKGPFLAPDFRKMPHRQFAFAAALLDLPFDGQEKEHDFKSDGSRGIIVTAKSNAIIFKKEIIPGDCKLKKDLMISHRYRPYKRSHYREDDGELDLTAMLVNEVYVCEVIITNISGQRKDVTAMFQIPNGSLPVLKTKAIGSQLVEIDRYTTQRLEMQFYFPQIGKFQHCPSSISQDNVVTAKSELITLEVGKKRVIQEASTFKDLMMTTKTVDGKKAAILDLITNRSNPQYDTFHLDHKFDFRFEDITWLMSEDKMFLLNVVKGLAARGMYPEPVVTAAISRFPELIKDKQFVSFREDYIKLVRYFFNRTAKKVQGQQLCAKVMHYFYTPIECQLFDLSPEKLYEMTHHHLEYYPIVNQRAFPIGQQQSSEQGTLKQILNVNFRTTYKNFMYMGLHQDDKKATPKFKLQLAYYLQLQDRIGEAQQIYSQIKESELEENQVVLYHYMTAYFEFYKSAPDFAKIEEILKKYRDYPVDYLRKMFQKVDQQLTEVKQMEAGNFDMEDESQANVQAASNQAKDNTEIVHEVTVNEQGDLIIEQSNIQELTIKYYKIDAEVLFSRQPFIQDQAQQFSYVKPFRTATVAISQKTETIKMPEDLKKANIVIEINSQDIQIFKTFYQSDLKVQVNEKFGELRVYAQNGRPLPQVYVKVFSKNKSGQELFFRDGYTDIRGKFEYANSTSSALSLSSIQKFALFVSHADHGSVIKECGVPKAANTHDE